MQVNVCIPTKEGRWLLLNNLNELVVVSELALILQRAICLTWQRATQPIGINLFNVCTLAAREDARGSVLLLCHYRAAQCQSVRM